MNRKISSQQSRRSARLVKQSANAFPRLELVEARQMLSATPLGLQILVNTYTTGNQTIPSIAMDADGDFVVAWAGPTATGNGNEILAQRFNASGVAQGTEFQVNTYTTSAQSNPVVGISAAGAFTVAWQSSGQDGAGYGIYAQRFTAAGAASGAEFKVNTYTTASQQNPAIGMAGDGRSVITWESSGQDGASYGIYAQRYDAAGATTATEFIVNQYTTSSQNSSTVAMDDDGDFVAAWNSLDDGGTSNEIWARQFTSSGTGGTEFHVNTYTTLGQRNASIANDSDGDFVISWESNGQDGNGYGIYARTYSKTGAATSTEFKVNTLTFGAQLNSAVAIDADGDFVVTWQGNTTDGSGYNVYAQQYSAAGVTDGTETLINSYTTGTQSRPVVAMADSGVLAYAWQSATNADGDGLGSGIFARVYSTGTGGGGGAPTVLGANFIYASAPQRVEVVFDSDVSASLGIGSGDPNSDLLLSNTTTTTTIDKANITVSWNASSKTATYTWPSLPNTTLPDGKYTATIQAAGVSNGTAMAADYTFNFFFLNGDADHNGVVDVADLGALATNWQQSPRVFAQGDFNYSGMVDVADLGILATNWQKSLLPLAQPFALTTATQAAPALITRKTNVQHVTGLLDGSSLL